MTLAKAKVITYDSNSSFITLATVITIVNYDHKTFIVQATGVKKNAKTLFVDPIVVSLGRKGFCIDP